MTAPQNFTNVVGAELKMHRYYYNNSILFVNYHFIEKYDNLTCYCCTEKKLSTKTTGNTIKDISKI